MHKRSREAKYKRPPPSEWGIGHMAYQTAAGPRDTNGPSCVLRPFYHFLLHILIYILSNIFLYTYSPIYSLRFSALCVLCVSYVCILCAQTILSLSFEAMHHIWCIYSHSYLFIFSLPSFWITGFSDAEERLRREVSFPRGFKMSWGDLACTAFAAKPQPATFFRNTEHIFRNIENIV